MNSLVQLQVQIQVTAMSDKKLPITEELDFAYLLTLMPPLYNTPEFAWLPELFSIIGHERLIQLCKYCGGERIRIPTLEQLNDSIDALQWFYDIKISGRKSLAELPIRLSNLYNTICNVYEERDAKPSERRYKIVEE